MDSTETTRLYYSRHVDSRERLPDFETHRPTIFPVPIMRLTSRRDPGGMDTEYSIKCTLNEEGDNDGDIVERLVCGSCY